MVLVLSISFDRVFQLTRSRGAWLRSDFYKDDIFDFNSHAHVERDQPFTKTHVKDLNFNSHAHVERDQA